VVALAHAVHRGAYVERRVRGVEQFRRDIAPEAARCVFEGLVRLRPAAIAQTIRKLLGGGRHDAQAFDLAEREGSRQLDDFLSTAIHNIAHPISDLVIVVESPFMAGVAPGALGGSQLGHFRLKRPNLRAQLSGFRRLSRLVSTHGNKYTQRRQNWKALVQRGPGTRIGQADAQNRRRLFPTQTYEGPRMTPFTATQTTLPAEVRDLYPFESHYLTLEHGHRLHYVDEGSGPVLLMVHGNPNWSFYYRHLICALREQYRCIAVDHLGCGLSDKPQDWGYRIPEHSANLLRLIEELGLENVTLLAHDWGGAIGFWAALQSRETFVRFVVFNSAVFLLPLPKLLTTMRLPLYGSFVVRGLNAMVWAGLLSANRNRMRGAVRAGYLAPYDSWANRVAVKRFVDEIPLERDHPNRALMERLESELKDFKNFPLMVVWGLKDPVFHPGYLTGWRERFPDAEYHAFDDVGHWLLEETPERIVPLVRSFLARTQ
jgi:pimeloyl-ACP methyl ester carboxylesterase